jgi:hypothetical protein
MEVVHLFLRSLGFFEDVTPFGLFEGKLHLLGMILHLEDETLHPLEGTFHS